jgi:hypothetical protein
MRCPNCGRENPSYDNFCGQCGTDLSTGLEPEHELNDEDDYYEYEWFGERHIFAKWRWQLGVAMLGAVLVLYALIFLGAGWYINAIILISVAILGVFLYNEIGKRKSGLGVLAAVGIVVVAGMFVGMFPWQQWAEDQHERYMAPQLVDDLSCGVDNGAHVTVDGTVTNVGRTGCTAIVHIKAYGGYPSNPDDNVFGAFKEGYVQTAWLAPNGGSDSVHWECTLSYFNGYGQVSWEVQPSSS